jgi:hypothetical protein
MKLVQKRKFARHILNPPGHTNLNCMIEEFIIDVAKLDVHIAELNTRAIVSNQSVNVRKQCQEV